MENLEKRILGQGPETVSSLAVCFQMRIPVMAHKYVVVCVCVHCVVCLVTCNLGGSF